MLFHIFDAMYSGFQLAQKWVRYYCTALNGKGHGIHSPFVFDFVRQVLNDRRNYTAYAVVESLRRRLMQEDILVNVEDMGAGTTAAHQAKRKLAHIARYEAKPAKYGQLLYRMVRYFQPHNVIELGTSLGITTAYLALASPSTPVTTLEGAPALAARAAQSFQELCLANVSGIEGHFDATLPGVLQATGTPGLVFIDGNHRKAPTLQYFSVLLEKAGPATILVFDDIHWSREMEEAWEEVRAHPAVKLTIDLFFLGLVFFREEYKVRQHFTIRY